jgi:hypothetical protein
MSAIQQAIVASTPGGPPPPPPSPSAYAYYNGTSGEGAGVNIYVSVSNWTGSRIWWKVVGSSGYGNPIDISTDITGTSSGFWDPGAGSYADYVGSITFVADQLTEGTEYWGVTLGSTEGGSDYGTSGWWGVLDNSTTPPPTASFWVSGSFVNEGDTATANVTTTNIPDGTTMYWWKKGGTIVANDVDALSGSFTINSNSGSFSVTPRADQFTEGSESLQISIGRYADQSEELWWSTLIVYDTSTLGSSMVSFSSLSVPTPAVDQAMWLATDGGGGAPNGIIHNSWTRDTQFYGGVTSDGNTWTEFPSRVAQNYFTIEMIANFSNVGGWQTVWDTGSMNEGGQGFTCVYLGTQMFISTNYGTGSAGQSSFTCNPADYEGLAHWIFVVDLRTGDNCQVYRNGVALSKIAGTAVDPLDYGTKDLMFGARRGPSYAPTDYGRGTIYFIAATATAYSAGLAASVYDTRRNAWGTSVNAPPTYGITSNDPVTGQEAYFATNQYSGVQGWNVVQPGWKAIAVGGSQAGWTATITQTNSTYAGGLRIAYADGPWPTDATSFKLLPF